MMNCVLTQHSTVTRSRSMISTILRAEKWSMITHGAPRMVGVKWPVHSPKPNGAGTTDMNTSSGRSAPSSAAFLWK